ncbi:UNVERIFIED_CONTAM: O-fucosyltransferase 36 [Sesamum radiatum]|uniref:O-fucosyltransferase 36 n=1 Tax=Sesamum radiatum TaxID=300843 RepID=A0AAW2V6Q4_SESRA
MDLEASDEKDDRQHLISQSGRPNDVMNSPSSNPPSTFQIDDGLKSPFSGVCRFKSRCLVAICLLVPILVLCFTIDFKNMLPIRFPRIEVLTNSSIPVNRMRSSELQALFLLKQQEFELFKMWNYTTLVNKSELNLVNSSTSLNTSSDNHDSAASPSSSVLEDLKSRIFSQISLNKQIQGVLLSSHEWGWIRMRITRMRISRFGIGVGRWIRGYLRGELLSGSQDRTSICLRFVFLDKCNHLICLEKHMFFAALLDRVLVIPSAKVDFEFRKVLDIEHINKCLGRKVVVTFEEFAESKKNHLHVDKFMCYFSLPQPCFVDDDHVKKLEGLGLALSKIETVWEEDVKQPKQRTVQDILAKFSSDDDVIAIGDVFFADVDRQRVMQSGGPIAHKCKTLIEPSAYFAHSSTFLDILGEGLYSSPLPAPWFLEVLVFSIP